MNIQIQEPTDLSTNKNQNLVNKYDTSDERKNSKFQIPKTNILIKES